MNHNADTVDTVDLVTLPSGITIKNKEVIGRNFGNLRCCDYDRHMEVTGWPTGGVTVLPSLVLEISRQQ